MACRNRPLSQRAKEHVQVMMYLNQRAHFIKLGGLPCEMRAIGKAGCKNS